jgi:hypothetical protein
VTLEVALFIVHLTAVRSSAIFRYPLRIIPCKRYVKFHRLPWPLTYPGYRPWIR